MACEKPALCGRVTFIASVLVALMFVVNAGLILSNRALQDNVIKKQTELNEKTTKIGQNNAFANINQSLINALGAAAVTKKDEQIRSILIQNNINLPAPGKTEGEAKQPAGEKE